MTGSVTDPLEVTPSLSSLRTRPHTTSPVVSASKRSTLASTASHRSTYTTTPTSLSETISQPRSTEPEKLPELHYSLSVALIREFLVARGLDKTLACFKSEISEASKNISKKPISSRSALASHLSITKSVESNRIAETPLDTYLEILVSQTLAQDAKHSTAPAREQRKPTINQKAQQVPLSASSMTSSNPSRRVTISNNDHLTNSSSPRSSLGEFSSTNKSAVSTRPPLGVHQSEPRDNMQFLSRKMQDKVEYKVEACPYMIRSNAAFDKSVSSCITLGTGTGETKANHVSQRFLVNNDLEITDNLELSDDEGNMTIQNPVVSIWNESRGIRISPHQAGELRRLLFSPDQARGRMWFGDGWRNKGFVFQDKPHLGYGLVQTKGGPCGLLAATQALVVKNLIYAKEFSAIRSNRLRPTQTQSRLALVQALAEMIWQAGEATHRAVVVVFTCLQFTTNDTSSNGIIQLLISLILSKGVDTIRQDMDDPEGKLIGRHEYCTQDMVNLALYGKAISNIHDGDIDLGGGTILKGVKKQTLIGQLSLFEHYKNIIVGNFIKSPTLPIFVICSESHYTVLFGLDQLPISHKELNSMDKFDIYYYDGLANQQEEIRLTVQAAAIVPLSITSGGGMIFGHKASDLIPPLELCIRTKWIDCTVNWNGTEPLL
ncbi:hypothetical protein BASA83_005797 [Batrachochytrium salamandrivorans]|nr:hypothetical protein BASA83_005797 [Batrachochytrium salamandrivorans]